MGDLNANQRCQILTLVTLLTLTVSIGLTAAAPACTESSGAQMCLVTSNADIFLLPEATEIHIGTPETHTVKLKDGVFPALSSLRTLWIDLRYISKIEDDAFINLTELTMLVFENTDIYRPQHPKTISIKAFRGLGKLTELQAPDSGMQTINPNSLDPLVSLTKLDFSDNLLTSVHPTLFQHTTKLSSINLGTNGLTTIPQELYSPLTELKSLDLSHNSIASITDGTFTSNTNLLQLSVDHNMLSDLSANVLGGLTNVVSLKLNDNKISSIDVNTFSSANKLEVLDLSSNSLESLADNTFSALPQVEFLELYNNKLKAISTNMLSGLSNLKYFDAYNNVIEKIEDGAFRHCKQLVSLHIHYNRISDISTSAFAGLNGLSALTLYNNSLSGLPKGVFDNFSTLNLLDISENAWMCDCTMAWLHIWLESVPSMKLENAGKTTCTGTDQLLTVYLLTAVAQCIPTTLAPKDTTTRTPFPAYHTYLPTDSTSAAVVVIDHNTGLHEKVTVIQPVTSVAKEGELTDAEKGGIIAACLFTAFIIILLLVLFLYCRHKRYFFWKPQKIPKTASLNMKERQETERIVREQLRLSAQNSQRYHYYDPENGQFWMDPRGQVHVVDNGVIVNGNYTIANGAIPHQSVYTLPNSTPNMMISQRALPSAPSANSSVSCSTNDSGFMISPPLPPVQRSGFSNMAFEDSGGEMSPVSAVRQFRPSNASQGSIPSLQNSTPLTESVVLGMLSPVSPTGPSGYLYPVNSKVREHHYATIDGTEHPYNIINDNDIETLPIRPHPGSPNHTELQSELQSSFDPRNYMIRPVNESTPVSGGVGASDSIKKLNIDPDDLEDDVKPPLNFDNDDDSTLGCHKEAFSDSMNSQCASISSVSTNDDSAIGEATGDTLSPPQTGYKKRKPVPKPRKLHKSVAKKSEEDFPPVFDEK